MRKFFPRMALVAAPLALLFAVIACTRSQKTESHDPVEKVDATSVRVFKDALDNLKLGKAIVMDFPDQLLLMGKVSITEDRTTVVPARASGRIETISFASGESVQKGQLLATLYSPDFVSAKEEYLQSIKSLKKSPDQSESSDFSNLAEMARKKLATMGLSKEDIDAISANPEGTEGKTNSAYLTIRAPRSGVLIAKAAVLGNSVNLGDTLFTIGDMSKVWFAGDLFPEDLPKVHKDQGVVIQVAGADKLIYGKVSFISPMVDPTTRSIKIRALMDNPNGVLKADMYVQGRITLTKRKALLVQTSAIVRTPTGDVVFKRVSEPSLETQGSMVFKRIPVKIGNEQEGMTAVQEGLSDGDGVVADGAWLLDRALDTSESAK